MNKRKQDSGSDQDSYSNEDQDEYEVQTKVQTKIKHEDDSGRKIETSYGFIRENNLFPTLSLTEIERKELFNLLCEVDRVKMSKYLTINVQIDPLIFTFNSNGKTLMDWICTKNHKCVAEWLINSYDFVIEDYYDRNNWNIDRHPIMVAYENKSMETCKFLIKSYCNSHRDTQHIKTNYKEQRNEMRHNFFQAVCYLRMTNLISIFMEIMDNEMPFRYEDKIKLIFTAVHAVCEGGHLEIFKMLISKYGATSLNRTDSDDGTTPLNILCKKISEPSIVDSELTKKRYELLEYFITLPTYKNYKDHGYFCFYDKDNISPIGYLCKNGDFNLKYIKSFLDLDKNRLTTLNINDQIHNTIFNIICECNQVETMKLFLQYKNISFNFPLTYNGNDNNLKKSAMLCNVNTEIFKILFNAEPSRIDYNICDSRGYTAFHKMCSIGKGQYPSERYRDNFKLFLEYRKCIDLNRGDSYGYTGLYKACESINVFAVRMLVECPGVEITLGNVNYNPSPLYALTSVIVDIVKGSDHKNSSVLLDNAFEIAKILIDKYKKMGDNTIRSMIMCDYRDTLSSFNAIVDTCFNVPKKLDFLKLFLYALPSFNDQKILMYTNNNGTRYLGDIYERIREKKGNEYNIEVRNFLNSFLNVQRMKCLNMILLLKFNFPSLVCEILMNFAKNINERKIF